VNAAEYAKNVDAILRARHPDQPDRLHDRTSAVVVVNLLPDLAITPRFAASARRDVVGRRAMELNESLAASARRWGAAVIDLHAHSRNEVPKRPELVWTDGYHPSDAGYARWAELMWEGVARLIPHIGAAPTA
jgi:lysophospholipase L1-like esterase